MPPKIRVTREQILDAAMAIVRESGVDALNARAIAKRIGSSTQPIFSNYRDMNALHEDVMRSSYAVFTQLLAAEAESGRYPPYKASGMAYIRFAREEPQLFRAFFMRNRTPLEQIKDDDAFMQGAKDVVESAGIPADEATSFHLSMWFFVHGIATLLATGYLTLPEEEISRRITDVYLGLKMKFKGEDNG